MLALGAFKLSFYGFLHASECLSLKWSDIFICNDYIFNSLDWLLSERTINSYTCHFYNNISVWAMRNYHDMVTAKQPHDLVFSASTIEPLSLPQATTILCQILSQEGLYPLNYAPHSFRIGAATIAAAFGQTHH